MLSSTEENRWTKIQSLRVGRGLEGDLWFRIDWSGKSIVQISAKLSRGQGTTSVQRVCGLSLCRGEGRAAAYLRVMSAETGLQNAVGIAGWESL